MLDAVRRSSLLKLVSSISMFVKCDLCGAEQPVDDSCSQRFGRLLALEYENSTTYGAVHHLTVPCYMLQHNEYSRGAWLVAREMVEQFVKASATPDSLRHTFQRQSRDRTWRITGGPKLAEFGAIRWTCSIMDVRFDDGPSIYHSDITRWAIQLLIDSKPVIERVESSVIDFGLTNQAVNGSRRSAMS